MNIRILLFIIFTTHSFTSVQAMFSPKHAWRATRQFLAHVLGDNRTLVCMSEGKSIKLEPGENEQVIFTTGLCGCVAALLYVQNTNGTQQTILTHYPRNMEHHGNKLHELLSEIDRTSIEDVRLFVFGNPLEEDWHKYDGKEIVARYKHIKDSLQSIAQQRLQRTIPTQYVPYYTTFYPGKLEGEVHATLSNDNGLTVEISTWSQRDSFRYNKNRFKELEEST